MGTTMATKFVAWEVPTLEALKGSKVYILREKLNNGGQMNREEKDWLTRNVNSNTYFKSAVPCKAGGLTSLMYSARLLCANTDIGRNTRQRTRPDFADTYTAG